MLRTGARFAQVEETVGFQEGEGADPMEDPMAVAAAEALTRPATQLSGSRSSLTLMTRWPCARRRRPASARCCSEAFPDASLKPYFQQNTSNSLPW